MPSIKLKIFNKLPNSLKTKVILRRMPKFFIIEATNVCNHRCPLCPWHTLMKRKLEYLSYENFEKIFEKIEKHAEAISFYLMGEPFLNRDIFRMIKLCADKNIKTHISSNGMLVEDMIDKILDSGLSSIQITLDGFRPETHEKYRVGSDFQKVIRGIKCLTKKREMMGKKSPKISIQTLIFKFNENEIRDIENFAKENGVDNFSVKSPNMGRGIMEKDEFAKVFLNESEEYKEYNRTDIDNKKFYKNKKYCPQFSNGVVLVNGDVVPCCFDYDGEAVFGNILDKKLEEIWKGKKREKFIGDYLNKKNILCNRCDFLDELGKKIF